jgi:hypothetical protein
VGLGRERGTGRADIADEGPVGGRGGADLGQEGGTREGGQAGGVEKILGREGKAAEGACAFGELGGEPDLRREPGEGGALLRGGKRGDALVNEAGGGFGGEGLPVDEGHFLITDTTDGHR